MATMRVFGRNSTKPNPVKAPRFGSPVGALHRGCGCAYPFGERAGTGQPPRTDPKPDAEWSGERPMNIIEHPPLPVTGISEYEQEELRMLDAMESLLLGQLATARRRRRDILLEHGILTYRSVSKILVMRGEVKGNLC